MACRPTKQDCASAKLLALSCIISSPGLTAWTSSLPLGIGMLLANVITGRLLDRDFRATRRNVERLRIRNAEAKNPESPSRIREVTNPRKTDPNDLIEFPIEHARLRSQPICAFSSISKSRSTISSRTLLMCRLHRFLGQYNRIWLAIAISPAAPCRFCLSVHL
jgi:hypothetical protein